MLNKDELKTEIESSSTIEVEAADLINSSLDIAVGMVKFNDRELLSIDDHVEDEGGGGHGRATVRGSWSAPALSDLADGVIVGNSATARVEFTYDADNNFTFAVLSVDPKEAFDEEEEYEAYLEAELDRKWDNRFFALAKHVSAWSKDPKAKVGAVLVNSQGWPIALGFNGFAKGVEDDVHKLRDGELKNKMVVHAEQNALLCSGAQAKDGIIYVYGKPVCPRCAVLLIQAGVKRVVGVQPDPVNNPDSDTHNDGIISLEMFREAGVEFSPSPDIDA